MKTRLTPPNKNKCQRILRLSGQSGDIQQCHRKPACIAHESKPRESDGKMGSMKLCGKCRDQLIKRFGKGYAVIIPIKRKKK